MTQFRITGEFFSPRCSRADTGVLISEDETLSFIPHDGQASGTLQIKSIQGTENIFFQCGSYFKAHSTLPQEFLICQSGRTKRFIAWLEKFNLTKAVVLIVILAAFVVLFRLTISSISYGVAMIIPAKWEQQLGLSVYESIRDYAFEQSELSKVQKEQIRTDSKRLSDSIEGFQTVDIYFHSSKIFGANALAFPGGPVVITDDLVMMMNRDEILAVVAHEYAHIHQRHSLQRIIEVAAASFLAFVVFGADESVIEEISAVLIQLWGLKQSRELEKKADLLALEFLHHAGEDPISLVTAIEKFSTTDCDVDQDDLHHLDCDDESWSWLSSHPSSAERSVYLRSEINN